MGSVTNYSGVVRQILSRVAEHLKRIPKPGVDTLLLEDPTQSAFLLKRVGWHEGKRVNNTVIFARVRDGKVWIEDDFTDLSYCDELLRAGVPDDDIIAGFQPPESRRSTTSAVA